MTVFGPVVLLAMGPPGQQMHVAAREMLEARTPRPNTRWFDLNVQGNHLPQMYAKDEAIEVTGPSSVVHHGLCPSCMGWGLVERIVPEATDETPCATCDGTGRPGIDQRVERDANSTVVHASWDPAEMAKISCDVCRAAFEAH